MIGVVVAAHGGLAQAFVDTAQLVMPLPSTAIAVPVKDEDDSNQYERRLRDAVEQLSDRDGVLILTDMFGGTPSNVGLTMHDPGKVEVLTGINLPMLLKAMELSGKDVPLEEAARTVREYGQRSTAIASEVLSGASLAGRRPKRNAGPYCHHRQRSRAAPPGGR